MTQPLLDALHVLVVEDEYFIMADLVHEFGKVHGASIVGPAATVREALTLVESTPRIDVASLDVNLGGERVFPVAAELTKRRVPFVFTTGYDSFITAGSYESAPRCQKPVDPPQIARLLARLVGREGG